MIAVCFNLLLLHMCTGARLDRMEDTADEGVLSQINSDAEQNDRYSSFASSITVDIFLLVY